MDLPVGREINNVRKIEGGEWLISLTTAPFALSIEEFFFICSLLAFKKSILNISCGANYLFLDELNHWRTVFQDVEREAKFTKVL